MKALMLSRPLVNALLLCTSHERCPSPQAVATSPSLVAPDGVTLRVAERHELNLVAQLQLDIFAPPDEPPPLLPMLQSLFEANERAARKGMRKRLTDELIVRVEKGSEIIIAVDNTNDVEGLGGEIDASGEYGEPGPPLLGAVDVSIQEMKLPTHAIAEGLYLSHMAVAEAARRRGIGRALLAAASAATLRRGSDSLWLHVEPDNEAAIGLYESAGYKRQPDGQPYGGFTLALNLQNRAVLYHKDLCEEDS